VRTWGNVRDLLQSAELLEPVRSTALAVFERLADAEARVHRTTPERVHFHEVGALDALGDVVGAAAGLHALRLDDVRASSVATGVGHDRSEHGALPIPSPQSSSCCGVRRCTAGASCTRCARRRVRPSSPRP
jgi:uncharacterized protein (DUF111 family)